MRSTAANRTPDHGSRPSSSSSGKTHRLPASRAASSAASPTTRWSAMFNPPNPHRSSKFASTSTLGPVPTDGPGQVAAQRETGLDHTVAVVEELDRVDADVRGAGALLVAPQRSGLVGMHAVDPGLARGREHVADPLALVGPAGDRARGAVLEVVRMGDDRERPLPVLRQRAAAVRGSRSRTRERVDDPCPPVEEVRAVRRHRSGRCARPRGPCAGDTRIDWPS